MLLEQSMSDALTVVILFRFPLRGFFRVGEEVALASELDSSSFCGGFRPQLGKMNGRSENATTVKSSGKIIKFSIT